MTYPYVCRACKQGRGPFEKAEIAVALRPQGGFLLWQDRSGEVQCVVCGSNGAQLHHWAPRHLFQDADQWPMSPLCVPCHTRWHDIVTPHMSSALRPLTPENLKRLVEKFKATAGSSHE